MDTRKMQKHSRRTSSRVNEKIVEYCQKFGQNRDLEKFMRLTSPASSCRSRSCTTTTSTASASSSLDGGGNDMRFLFRLQEATNSSSIEELKNVGAKERIIPIRMEGEAEHEALVGETKKRPTTPETPIKTQPTGSKQTQTPDSIAKTHKRLEWDSLADVGYKKSMSTSNISILERSVLREFFQESEKLLKSSNASEGDLKQLQAELLQERKLSALTATTTTLERKQNNTPPLASSTMMSRPEQKRTQSTSTSTSLLSRRQSEKYAQTTPSNRACVSQEVQVSMSSATATPSLFGSTATPTSFELYSSRSSRSTTDDATSDFKIARRRRNQPHSHSEPPAPHPFVAGITEMLANKARRRPLLVNNGNGDASAALQQLHDTLKSALEENKENASSSSSFGRSPQLDLGIQLLCSLIEAKSLTAKQKKKLVRDIVRRISRMSDNEEESAAKVATATTDDKASRTRSLHASSTFTADRIKDATKALQNFERPSESGLESTNEQLLRVKVFKKPSPPTTSAKALAELAAQKAKSKYRESVTHAAADNATHPQPPTKNNVPKVATSRKDYDKTDMASQIDMPHEHDTTTKPPTLHRRTTNTTTATITTTTDKSSRLSEQSTASSSSKDLTTQKAAIPTHQNSSANTTDDAEQASMREWLNPLTQSEIEYEEKKRRESVKNSAKSEKNRRKSQNTNSDSSERDVQLNWIESEILRLESLRHLLLKENNDNTSSIAALTAAVVVTTTDVLTKSRQIKNAAEKLYDTVASEQNSASSGLSESAERLVQEIEVIIEESNEDVINLNENLKRTKERKRETQIIYDKPTAADQHGGLAQAKARFRTVKETIVRSEEQVIPTSSSDAKVQRSKIDTPSSGGSNDSESVGSFVQQRKREFLEHYKQKKKNHFAAMEEQEQQLRRQQQRQQRSASTGAMPQTTTTTSHYSVPLSMQRTHHQQLYNNNHMTSSSPPSKPPPPLPPHHFASGEALPHQSSSSTSHQHALTTHSSSSMFCISSEVSIPMGSNASSSTPTTTHQYDDVAAAGVFSYGIAGVGVQTGGSVMRMQPIFGPRPYDPYAGWRHPQAPICMRTHAQSTTDVSVQVKPKAIAYVIQFDGKTSSENSSSGTAVVTNSEELTTSAEGGQRKPQPEPQLTLQDHLERARPKFLAHVKQRKAILNQIQSMRQERERELRDIVAADASNASLGSLDRKLQRLPPPATKQIRIFPTKQMKAMTSKHCATLPEVLAKQERDREEQRRRGNRIIRDVFNRRLQKRVRNGQLDLNHSRTVI